MDFGDNKDGDKSSSTDWWASPTWSELNESPSSYTTQQQMISTIGHHKSKEKQNKTQKENKITNRNSNSCCSRNTRRSSAVGVDGGGDSRAGSSYNPIIHFKLQMWVFSTQTKQNKKKTKKKENNRKENKRKEIKKKAKS